MNVANFANLFHQNSIFQSGKPLGQALSQQPANDALRRLSENLLAAQDQSKDLKARFDTFELSAEAIERGENSKLEDMPEGLLHIYLNQCKVGAHLSQMQETSLMEYRDRLSAFDQTIQEYQDMLDGKAELPKMMNMEDASMLLERTKAAREQFLQKGAAELNRVSNEGPTLEGFLGKAYDLFAEEAERGQGDTRWQIDPAPGDIYGEIDRALASAHKVTSTFQKGASSILSELKRRGCVQEGEDFSLDNQDADAGASERASLFQDIYQEIWSMLRENGEDKSE